MGIGPGLTGEASVSTEVESPEGANERQNETLGSSAIDPLDPTAGLEYVAVKNSPGLEILAGSRGAMSFTVPTDGTITGVELLDVGDETCRAQEDLDFRLMATVNGYPGPPIFYSAAIPARDLVLGGGNYRIDLSEVWHVGAYQTLALELSTDAEPRTGDNCYYGWNGDNPGPTGAAKPSTAATTDGPGLPLERTWGFGSFSSRIHWQEHLFLPFPR